MKKKIWRETKHFQPFWSSLTFYHQVKGNTQQSVLFVIHWWQKKRIIWQTFSHFNCPKSQTVLGRFWSQTGTERAEFPFYHNKKHKDWLFCLIVAIKIKSEVILNWCGCQTLEVLNLQGKFWCTEEINVCSLIPAEKISCSQTTGMCVHMCLCLTLNGQHSS